MPLPNITSLTLLVAALGTPLAAWAIDLPSAGSLGNQLQQDPVKLGEQLPPVEHDLIKPQATTEVAPPSAATTRVSRVVFAGVKAGRAP